MSALVVCVSVLAAGFKQQRVADVVREQLHSIVLGCGGSRSRVREGVADEHLLHEGAGGRLCTQTDNRLQHRCLEQHQSCACMLSLSWPS